MHHESGTPMYRMKTGDINLSTISSALRIMISIVISRLRVTVCDHILPYVPMVSLDDHVRQHTYLH